MNMTPEKKALIASMMQRMQETAQQSVPRQGVPYQSEFDPTTGQASRGLLNTVRDFVPPQAISAPDMRPEVIAKSRAELEQSYPQGLAGGVMSGKELGALLAKPAFTDQPDEYYLDTRITDFNEAELEELRRRINEREDFSKRYYGS